MRLPLQLAVFLIAMVLSHTASRAGDLEVPVMVRADGDLDTCALGGVTGLNPKGDNFLAVRSGPGTNYAMIDKLHAKDQVWMFGQQGSWVGVVYGVNELSCSPVAKDHAYQGPGKKGWVHKKFLIILAG